MAAIDERTVQARSGTPSAPPPATGPGAFAVAAIASLGAGAIHATAAGAHREHRAAVVAFVVMAVAQLAWGAWALGRPGRLVGLLGAAVNAAAFGGWLQAKTGGISFIICLDTKESGPFGPSKATAPGSSGRGKCASATTSTALPADP